MLIRLGQICTFALFILAASGTVTPLHAHCVENDPEAVHSGDHPHCSGNTTDIRLYDVTITGRNRDGNLDANVFYGEGNDWQANTKQVGFNFSNPAGPNGFLELKFFRELFSANGDNCFPFDPTDISSVILQKAKRGTAKAHIWFDGYTNDSSKEVLYHFEFNGVFLKAKDWPPEDSNTMMISDWELHLGNEGNTIKAISCLSSGDVDDDTDFGGIDIQVDLSTN